jgi:putative hemolysin
MDTAREGSARRGRRGGVAAGIAIAAMAAGLVAAPVASAATPASWKSYCRNQGGAVQVRTPAAGTNSPPVLKLAGPVAFCRFTSAQDGSRIFVDLRTLTTTRPTLAALAYLTMPKPGNIPGNVNPASIYCSRLGGSDQFGGVNAAGGGWIVGNDANTSLQACVFPDGSIIDSFGILYHSQKVVRGADLTTRFRYRPAKLPQVFG